MMYPPDMAPPGTTNRYQAPLAPSFYTWRRPVAVYLPLALGLALVVPLLAGLRGEWQGLLIVSLPSAIGVAVGLGLIEGRRREGGLTSRGAVLLLFLGLGACLSLIVPALLGLGLATALSLNVPDAVGGGLAAFALVMIFGVGLGLIIGLPLALVAGLAVAFIALGPVREGGTEGADGPWLSLPPRSPGHRR